MLNVPIKHSPSPAPFSGQACNSWRPWLAVAWFAEQSNTAIVPLFFFFFNCSSLSQILCYILAPKDGGRFWTTIWEYLMNSNLNINFLLGAGQRPFWNRWVLWSLWHNVQLLLNCLTVTSKTPRPAFTVHLLLLTNLYLTFSPWLLLPGIPLDPASETVNYPSVDGDCSDRTSPGPDHPDQLN